MKIVLIALTFALPPRAVLAEDRQSIFADQAQYELFYEYGYQSNFVERLIFECTADDEVWATFAYATAPVTNAYMRHVLESSIFQPDPFTNQRLISRVLQETALNLTRSSKALGDPADPVLMAQRDVLRLVQLHSNDIDSLCDFVFWEEVAFLEQIVSNLLQDAEVRLEPGEYTSFLEDAEDGLPILRKLFAANPLITIKQ